MNTAELKSTDFFVFKEYIFMKKSFKPLILAT